MFAEILFASIALACCAVGAYTDLKGRWVPDWINFFMIFFGLGGHAILSVLQKSIWPLAYALIAVGVFYGASACMFYTGVWGGGDAKMFIGLGALFPTFSAVAPWPFLLTLWFNVLIFGVLFGLLSIFFLAFKHKDKFKQEFSGLTNKNKFLKFWPALLAIPFVSFFAVQPIFPLALLAVLLVPLILVAKSVENACMFKQISPSRLTEGDWIAEEIKIGNYFYKPAKTGIEKKDILKLVELEKAGKLSSVKVKEGLPYVPAFLAGLIVSLAFGDLMLAGIKLLV